MTAVDTDAMAKLQDLLNERQRYEGWLNTLVQRKDGTPTHVYERVHGDYTKRLDGVLAQLSERTEQLRGTIDVLNTRLETLRGHESERMDVRQESELRAAVGEYSEDEWNYLREEADREIATIAEERRGVEAELQEMQRIVESTRPSQQAKALAEDVPTAAAQAENVETSPVATAKQDGTPKKLSDTQPANSSGPLFDNFVAGWPTRRSAESAEPPAASAQSDGTPRAPEVDTANTVKAPPRYAPPTQRPASPTDSRRDAEKTLKCPECGTMNYATEWYCERCGGELATF